MMDYILQLRQDIGHRPLVIVGAGILVLDEQKRLLLLKRSDNQCWAFPGGSLEPGELVEDTARRETFEETNLEINEISLLGVFSGPELYYKYPNGDEAYNVIIAYVSQDWHGNIKLNDEHTEWRWFKASDIPENISPPVKPIIEQFKTSFSMHHTIGNT